MKTPPPAHESVPFFWPIVLCLIVWLVVAFCLTSCTPGTVTPPITIEGNFADYSYSSKGGLVIRPRSTVIRIRDDK